MKQVNFAIRIATLSAGGINGSMTSAQFTDWIKTQHPIEDGWRVDNFNVVQTSADGISVAVLLTQWKEEVTSLKSK